MTLQPFAAVAGIALALAGCSSGPPPPPAFTPDPQPDHVRLISENLKTIFSENAQPRNIVVSELRQVAAADGASWGACLRLNATGMTGQPTLPRTGVVVFRRNAIIERRLANPDDCLDAKFTPLAAAR